MLTVGVMVDISMDWWDKLQETTNISWENRWFLQILSQSIEYIELVHG